jgi:hypothetical protein
MKTIERLLPIFLILSGGARAAAAVPAAASLTIVGADACPSATAVRTALAQLVSEPSASADNAPGVHVRVEDRGPFYDVSVGSAERSVADPERHCDERARTVAVMAAVALMAAPESASPLPSTAVALSVPAPAKPAYPWALLDRPLVAPRGTAFVREEVTLGALPGASTYGATEVIGGEVGVGHGVQLGLQAALPLVAAPNGGTVLASLQVGLTHNIALFVEGGYERAQFPEELTNVVQTLDAGVLGVALPSKWKLNRWVGITAFGGGLRSQWLLNYGDIYSPLSAVLSTDLFSVRVGGTDSTTYSVFVPVGLLLQPHPMFALHIQTGPRLIFSNKSFTNLSAPLNVDAVVTPHSRVDVGVSLGLNGALLNGPSAYATSIGLAAFLRIRL